VLSWPRLCFRAGHHNISFPTPIPSIWSDHASCGEFQISSRGRDTSFPALSDPIIPPHLVQDAVTEFLAPQGGLAGTKETTKG